MQSLRRTVPISLYTLGRAVFCSCLCSRDFTKPFLPTIRPIRTGTNRQLRGEEPIKRTTREVSLISNWLGNCRVGQFKEETETNLIGGDSRAICLTGTELLGRSGIAVECSTQLNTRFRRSASAARMWMVTGNGWKRSLRVGDNGEHSAKAGSSFYMSGEHMGDIIYE